jgi:AraC-like DNA-binding protein
MVTDAGYFPRAHGHRVERPQGAATHLLIVCLQGAGWVRSAERTFEILAGDCVWLPSNSPHAYGAAGLRPWTIVYAHFTGDEVPAWQDELGWAAKKPVGLLRVAGQGGTNLGLDRVYASLEGGYSMSHLLAASVALRSAFCVALEAAKGPGAVRTAAERTAALREEIVASPMRHYRLQELAASAGLSVPHFCLIFRRQTGYAPIDFLIRQRISRACRLLDTTTQTISTIAAEAGFEDPYYFSRCFHRVMGTSPREYRKQVKG